MNIERERERERECGNIGGDTIRKWSGEIKWRLLRGRAVILSAKGRYLRYRVENLSSLYSKSVMTIICKAFIEFMKAHQTFFYGECWWDVENHKHFLFNPGQVRGF